MELHFQACAVFLLNNFWISIFHNYNIRLYVVNMFMMDSAKLPTLTGELFKLFLLWFSRCSKQAKCHCKWVDEKHHLMANSCAVEVRAGLPLGCLGNVTAKKHRASLNMFISVDKLQALVSTYSTFWTTLLWTWAFFWRKLSDCSSSSWNKV